MNVFELFAKLGLDTSEYDKGLDDSEQKASGFSNALGKSLSTGLKVAGVGLAAVGAGATALGKNLMDNVGELAQYGDNIDKTSQKLGVSAEFYQEWEAVLQHSGTSMSSMSATFKTLANATQQTTEAQSAAFEALGLSVDELRNMSTEEVFSSVVYALQDMEEGTERTAIAADLLGRGAMEMGALLNTSSEDTQAMIDTVHDLGGVLSNTAVKDAAAYQDALQDMQTSMSGLKNNLNADFLPAITNVMNGLSLVFSGDDGGLGQINQGVSDFTANLAEQIPTILDIATSIIESLASAIIENIPKLVTTASTVIMNLVTYMVENLPLIIRSALDIILALSKGIIEALPTLIPTIIDVLLEIVHVLTNPDNLKMLLNAALEILVELAYGLVDAIPALVEAVFSIIDGIIEFLVDPENIIKLVEAAIEIVIAIGTGLINAIPKLIESVFTLIKNIIDTFSEIDWGEIGKNVVNGIWDGLKRAWEGLKKWFTDAWDNLVGGVKDLLGIHSPSRVFAEIGKNMAAGIPVGWDDEFPDVQRDIENSLDMNINPNLATTTRGTAGTDNSLQEFVDTFFDRLSDVLSDVNIDIDGRTFGRLVNRVV